MMHKSGFSHISWHLLLSLCVLAITATHAATTENLRCEYRTNPLGIATPQPRLSWVIVSNQHGERQTAYQVLVTSSSRLLSKNRGDLWDSGKVLSDQSIQVRYAGRQLLSRQGAWWKLRIWDRAKTVSAWSTPAYWEMGLLKPSDWLSSIAASQVSNPPLTIRRARYEVIDGTMGVDVTNTLAGLAANGGFSLLVTNGLFGDVAPNHLKRLHVEYAIGGRAATKDVAENGRLTLPDGWKSATWIGIGEDTRQSPLTARPIQMDATQTPRAIAAFPSPLLRRAFTVKRGVVRARAYICGVGYYELFVNGQRIGDQVLDPGQTTYDVRAFYVTHDITHALRFGPNAVGVTLGNGFYGQTVGFGGLPYGAPAVTVRLVIDYRDGTTQTIGTDTSWKAAVGPILFDNVYAGETYDARREQSGWSTAQFNAVAWQKASAVDAPTSRLEPQMMPPIRRIRTLAPVKMWDAGDGKWIFDLGQNIAGWVRLKLHQPAGTALTLRFAETLTRDGKQLDFASTGVYATGVVQTDIYICKGTPDETWEPRFTYHGFRYFEVEGLTAPPQPADFEGVWVRTAVENRGSFVCSNELLNRIYRTALWTIEDNLHSVPEDCPHRERCAWLGDAHAAAETGIYNFDMAQFWAKFVDDIETTTGRGGQTYWGQKATLGIPCNIAVGRRLCEEARPDWGVAVVFIPWFLHTYYGDDDALARHYDTMKRWCHYVDGLTVNDIVERGYGDWCPPNFKIECPVPLSSTALHYGALQIMAQTATLLGKANDAGAFQQRTAAVRRAFLAKFYNPQTGGFGSQTADSLALRFGLVPDGGGATVARDLAHEVTQRHGGHDWVGIHGARALYTALDHYGYDAVAFGALTQKTFPSFGYLFDIGMTTLPEIAASPQPDGSRNQPGASLNHPMHSGFAAWFHESLAGIQPLAPGFKRILIHPHEVQQVQWVKATHVSPYGLIGSEWHRYGATFALDITIPANTTAIVFVPAKAAANVMESDRLASQTWSVRFLRMEDGCAVYAVGAGDYRFGVTE